MSESILDDNLISTFEQTLRQTRIAQNRLLGRLRDVENEADRLRQEIEALENSAQQTEAAINSVLATLRSGNQPPKLIKNMSIDENYEIPDELRRPGHRDLRVQDNLGRSSMQNYPVDNYGDAQMNYPGNNRGIPSISRNIEPISNRFSDRTITQACTLLLRESGNALHVNELYNLLVAGGFEFKGNNPTISIAVSLNRNSRFRKVAPGTFDLVMRDASQAAS